MFDRFTRDEVSSWVWWPATMVLVVLFVLTFPGQNRAIDQRHADAEARAWSAATGTLGPALDDVAFGPIGGQTAGELRALAQARILGAPWAETVRIWAADSTLLWSSEASDPVGSAAGLNDEQITRALADQTRALGVVSERDLDGRPSAATYSAYAPFTFGGEIAAAQFEVPVSTLMSDVRGDWLGYRIVLGLATLLTFALAIGSMREPVARIGAGVPLSRASLPPDMELIEVERKLELERAGANARERVTHMEQRLRESEELRMRAEGDLQKALSQLAIQPGRPARSVIPRPGGEPSTSTASAVAPDDGLIVVPTIPDERVPTDGRVAATTTEVRPPSPTTDPRSEPRRQPVRRRPAAATTWEPASRRGAAAAPNEGAAAAPTQEAAAEPAQEPAARPARKPETAAARASEPETETAAARAPEPEPEPVVVVPVASDAIDADAGFSGVDAQDAADADARDVLERLVEPVAASVAPMADPSVLRAKLARTAALKKPGSRHDERLRDDDDAS